MKYTVYPWPSLGHLERFHPISSFHELSCRNLYLTLLRSISFIVVLSLFTVGNGKMPLSLYPTYCEHVRNPTKCPRRGPPPLINQGRLCSKAGNLPGPRRVTFSQTQFNTAQLFGGGELPNSPPLERQIVPRVYTLLAMPPVR